MRDGASRPRRVHQAVALALAVGALLTVSWVTAPYGPGASLDSVTYLSVARNLAEGYGFVRFDGASYVSWPPLYPLALSAGVKAGAEHVDAARAVNAVAFAATIVALFGIGVRAGAGLGWSLLACAIAAGSRPFVHTFCTVWSEAPFVAFEAGALLLVLRHESSRRRSDLVWLGAIAGAACLTRHVGFALVGAIALWLLLQPGGGRQRLAGALCFGAVASLAPLVWALRTGVGGGLASRGGGYAGLAENVRHYLENVAAYLQLPAPPGLEAAMSTLVLVGAPGVAIALWVRGRRKGTATPPAHVVVSALFVLLYSALLIAIASWTPVALLSRSRFGAPTWVPLVILFTAGAEAIWRRARGRAGRAAVLAVVSAYALSAWSTTLPALLRDRALGVHGFGKRYWHSSPLLEAVRKRYVGQTVLSNQPHAVYLHTSIPAGYSPRRHAYRSLARKRRDLEVLRARLERGEPVQLVWFGSYLGGYGYYPPRELRELGFCLQPEGRLADGDLYAVRPDADCAAPQTPAPVSTR